MRKAADIETKSLEYADDGMIPNNANCPLLYYKNVIDEHGDTEKILSYNNWGIWQGGLFCLWH